MDKIINLKTRKGLKNYLKRWNFSDGSESKTYQLILENSVVQGGITEDGSYFIDPVGGPTLVVGEEVENAGIIKYIDLTDKGYMITFA